MSRLGVILICIRLFVDVFSTVYSPISAMSHYCPKTSKMVKIRHISVERIFRLNDVTQIATPSRFFNIFSTKISNHVFDVNPGHELVNFLWI